MVSTLFGDRRGDGGRWWAMILACACSAQAFILCSELIGCVAQACLRETHRCPWRSSMPTSVGMTSLRPLHALADNFTHPFVPTRCIRNDFMTGPTNRNAAFVSLSTVRSNSHTMCASHPRHQPHVVCCPLSKRHTAVPVTTRDGFVLEHRSVRTE